MHITELVYKSGPDSRAAHLNRLSLNPHHRQIDVCMMETLTAP
eukprot:COSAG02_NODE_50915_length_317_cov_1.009174_1_plen_42_part_10